MVCQMLSCRLDERGHRMGQGTSGTFAVNGTNFLLNPTEAGWISKELIGISGNARPTYPSTREFEMTWEFMDMASFNQIQSWYESVQSTGTVTVDLPKYATTPYQFYSYSGCTLKEPEVSKFFEQNVTGVSLLILRAR